MTDRFIRVRTLLGREKFELLRGSFIAVAGLGAVGSYAVEALARAGVGKLRLVDFDIVQPSNINRQLYALESTLGRPKTAVAAARVAEINPDCKIEALELFLDEETRPALFADAPDMILDCIDSVSPKAALLADALRRSVPILSSMGAALRTDPMLIRVGCLSKVQHCPLARQMRKRLRKAGLEPVLPCVYSIEPVVSLPCAASESDASEAEASLRRGRPRTPMGSLPTLTAMFGITLAHEAIRALAGGFDKET